MAQGKKYVDATPPLRQAALHEPAEAFELVKSLANRKFDETVEAAFRLGVDPRKADQMLRGTVSLPAGTGKDVRVAVFADGRRRARGRSEAGADVVGADDLVNRVQNEGFLDFDVAIATPDLMGQVGRLGRVLGPRGLMPNPKTGTVTTDVGKAVARVQGRQGRVPHRPQRQRARAARQGELPGREPREELRRGARRDACGRKPAVGQGPVPQGHRDVVDDGPGREDLARLPRSRRSAQRAEADRGGARCGVAASATACACGGTGSAGRRGSCASCVHSRPCGSRARRGRRRASRRTAGASSRAR